MDQAYKRSNIYKVQSRPQKTQSGQDDAKESKERRSGCVSGHVCRRVATGERRAHKEMGGSDELCGYDGGTASLVV